MLTNKEELVKTAWEMAHNDGTEYFMEKLWSNKSFQNAKNELMDTVKKAIKNKDVETVQETILYCLGNITSLAVSQSYL